MRWWPGALGAMAGGAALACAPAAARPPLEVVDAWARPVDSAATTAVYFVLHNREAAPVSVIRFASPVSEAVMLHESVQRDGTVHMTMLMEPQTVAPGDSLVLKPGGKHLMAEAVVRALVAGDSVPMAVTLGDGRVVQVKAVVRAP
jgi:copper(I)-binding protein